MCRVDGPARAAQALRPAIREARQETEAAHCLAPQEVGGLIEAGLGRLALPTYLDGIEADPVKTM